MVKRYAGLNSNDSEIGIKSPMITIRLIVDPCESDIVRAAYVVLPNFQPSPEMTVTFSTEGTIDYTGKLQTSYCGTDKVLYQVFVCSDDEEDVA